MKYLFSDWDNVFSKIQKSRRVFLFFDYDGTLTPIVPRPALAKFPRNIKNLIKKLQKKPKFIVAIISGRSLRNIKEMVGIKGIIYAGNHGLEIEGKGVRFSKHLTVRSIRPLIRKIGRSLRKELGQVKGIIVEDKGAALGMHYRLAKPKDLSLIKGRFYNIVKPYIKSGEVKVSRGKKVLEVRPNINWDKGKAARYLLKGKRGALAIYLGDDVTDMDGFRAVKVKGISIFVGAPRRNICTDYFLRCPKDVERFIKKITLHLRQ